MENLGCIDGVELLACIDGVELLVHMERCCGHRINLCASASLGLD